MKITKQIGGNFTSNKVFIEHKEFRVEINKDNIEIDHYCDHSGTFYMDIPVQTLLDLIKEINEGNTSE